MRGWVLAAVVALAGCGGPEDPFALFPSYRDADVPIASKALFEPARYVGVWHEIARFPVPFEAGCTGVTAEYGLRSDGLLSVVSALFFRLSPPWGPLEVVRMDPHCLAAFSLAAVG